MSSEADARVILRAEARELADTYIKLMVDVATS